MLQFYVGTTEDELKTILCTRYQCENPYITMECDKHPIYCRGGKRNLIRTRRKHNKKIRKCRHHRKLYLTKRKINNH